MTTPIKKLMLAMAAAFTLCLGARAANEGKTWMVVDLRTGERTYYNYSLSTALSTFNTDLYKTEKMVFRRIPQGDYDVPIGDTPMAHIPTRSYVAHMPRNYYLAIFPVTIAQWEIIKDASSTLDQIGLPQYVHNTFNTYHWCKISDYREPQVRVSFKEIVSGKDDQEESALSAFFKTRGVRLELPTTAMWEVAMWARSIGDTSPYTRWFFGNGEEDYDGAPTYDDLRSYAWIKHDPVVHADYLEGGNAPHHPVGQLLPNAWGFYDMLGNCYEWSSDYACPTDMDAHNQQSFNPFDHDFHANSETNLHIRQELYEYARCLGYDSQQPDVPLDNQAYNFTYTISETKYRLQTDFRSRYMRTVSKSKEGMFTVGFRLAYVCTDEPGLDDEYTITWNDYDGTTLHWKRARYNSTPEYTWDPPVRPEDDRYSYTFAGWSPATEGPAVSNATYTATYIATPHVFHSVRWLNYDGTELFAGEVRDGFMPQYGGETPARSSDAQYHYNFSGWTPNVAAVYGDKTYTAVFDSLLRSYDVTWLDEDGVTELLTTNVPYGSMPEYLGTPPSKASTVQLTYSFAGWTPELEPATSNTAYTAMFDASPREYTIRWRKWDGTELFTTNVPYGATPVYLGATPTQPSTAQYDYVFSGWDREIEPVTEATTYRAMFTGVLRSYDITWLNYDGTVLCVTNGPYGETPVYLGAKPGRQAMDQYVYVFAGWTQEVVPVTSNATYEALHKLARGLRVVDVSDLNDSYTAQDGDVLTGVTTFGISIADNATVSLADMTSPGLACLGNATILIADDTVNTLNGTLRAGGAGSTLTIQGETGWLTTMASGNGAGIGALGNVACGNIVIEGGVIVAIGSGTGSGIGAGMSSGGCGNITISGGNVRAIGGTGGAPGIGCNRLSTCGDIVISGGVIAAEGYAAFNNDNAQMINKRPIYGTASMRIEGAITRLVSINHPDYRGRGSPIPGCDDAYGTIINTTIDEGLKQTQEGNTFTLEPKERFDITWANYDGTVLCVTNVPYGITPVYNGATPTKPPTVTSQFAFSGWTETVVSVTGAATYTAAYAETPRPYPVTWLNYDGTVLCVTNIPYGETPTYPGETLKRPGYFFNGWTPAIEAVTGEIVYTATYMNIGQDSGGYYLLGSVQEWQGFAALVETTPTANAKMIADIDLGDDQTHIGSMYESSSGGSDYSVYYKGIFDGQGHTLTVAYDTPAGQISAPFTKIQGALVKNLHVAGTIHAASAYIGVVGITSGDNCISNVWMSADITRPQSGWLFSASILGYFDRGTVTIVDCLYTGSSVGGGERYMGCFVGGTRDSYATVRIRNCLSVGTFDRGSGISSSWHANCYVKQFPTDIPAEMQVADEQLADGTTATALQAGREETVWVQDAEMGHPMLKMFGKKETAVTVGGVAVGEVVRGEDGKTLSFAVAAGTDAGDVKLDIGGVDVTKGFRVTVNGTEATAVLLAPYEVPKEEGAADEPWTDNGDGNVTLNVTVVPGLYYAADSAESLDALACPGASAPATDATTLTAPKPAGDKGFFKVWVSDAPIPAKP